MLHPSLTKGTLRKEVVELGRLGPLPSHHDADVALVERFQTLIEAIKKPVTDDEARVLVRCFGPDDCYGLVWPLVHLVETAPNWPLADCLEDSSNEWIQMLRQRVRNVREATAQTQVNMMVGEEKLVVSLTGLSHQKQLAFALLVFERMLPALIAFSKDTGFNDSCFLRARDAAWAALRTGEIDGALNEAYLSSAPDTEDFSHELTSHVLNAALAMSDIMEFTLDGRTDHIANVSRLARDSVDLYLGSLEPSIMSSPEKDERIAVHPLMQLEESRELEDIKFLSTLPDSFDERTISALKTRATTQGPMLPLSV